MKAYLLVFDPTEIGKDRFRDTIDHLESIDNWTLFFGNTMCVISRHDARVLSRQIRNALPDVRFMISAIDPSQKAGWLPKSIWQFINDPAPVAD